jgi:hypothetical protein
VSYRDIDRTFLLVPLVNSLINLFFLGSVGPPLWSSGHRYRGPGFDSRRFQIFREAVGLELGPLSLVRTTEELLGRNSSGSGQENRD